MIKPSITTALMNAKAAGHRITHTHVLPDGCVLYRMSNLDILKCKADGESLGRLCTNDWAAAKEGRVGG